jgi:hypothetical protein
MAGQKRCLGNTDTKTREREKMKILQNFEFDIRRTI